MNRAQRQVLPILQQALSGSYRVEREIGHGAMATVFHAEDLAGGPDVAIKVLRPEVATALGPARFQREIDILTRLRHPGIVPILGSGVAQGVLYLAMPLVAGEDLRNRLAREGWLPLPDVLAIARDLASAIDYAHDRNVLHRDIKPANILLESDRALVCDFGLARAISRSAVEPLSSSGLVLGTPAYMSPEQGLGREELSRASDLYALGCVLYELLTGEPPFTGPSPQAVFARHLADRPRPMRSVRPEIPVAWEAAVLAALAKAPEDRPQRGDGLIRTLGAW